MKNSKILILLVFLFLLISCSKSELKKIEEEEFLFGTSIKIVVYSTDLEETRKLIKNTFKLMLEIESKYNSRNKDSVVYKLNQNPCRKNDNVKTSTIDLRIEIETEKAFPTSTSAYCLILHDQIITYDPFNGGVRTL